MSLIEILVVITIFAVLGVVTTQIVLQTLRSSKKTQSVLQVRQNLNYALSVVERQIRSAQSIESCPFIDASEITYTTHDNILASFACTNGYIASGSAAVVSAGNGAHLTSTEVDLYSCKFSCLQYESSPPLISVTLEGYTSTSQDVENSLISVGTDITLRNSGN